MKKIVLVLGLFLTSCYAITGGRGLFESYYKVLEQDDFQMTILAVCNVYTCEDIFRQANLTAKEHCNSNKKKYTLILISHKLSNLKKCDLIYKIKDQYTLFYSEQYYFSFFI